MVTGSGQAAPSRRPDETGCAGDKHLDRTRPEQLLDRRPVVAVKSRMVKANTRGQRKPELYIVNAAS